MIGNSHQPRQQSYEDADEIQAGINQFQFHNIPLPQFSKVLEPLKHSSEFSFINLSIYNKLTLLKFQDFAFFTFSSTTILPRCLKFCVNDWYKEDTSGKVPFAGLRKDVIY